MSGTSADGIDAALLWTDGEEIVGQGPCLTIAYGEEFRAKLKSCFGGRGPIPEVEQELTIAHAEAVSRLLAISGKTAEQIVAIGFHGQTILHRPMERRTWQIGDGALLARLTGIDVVNDFRSADVAAGGQGAPLVPVFHRAILGKLARPAAFLNIGGVANVTWIGRGGELLAFDTGPGNALIDDWIARHTGSPMDRDGSIASSGTISLPTLGAMLAHPYFRVAAPKSLDRDDFRNLAQYHIAGLSLADGARTLTAFTAASIAEAARLFPETASTWIVCGGGRRNSVLMRELAQRITQPIVDIDELGWDGDGLEALAFAYLAGRSLRGLPISFPGSTGVPKPLSGGILHRSKRD